MLTFGSRVSRSNGDNGATHLILTASQGPAGNANANQSLTELESRNGDAASFSALEVIVFFVVAPLVGASTGGPHQE